MNPNDSARSFLASDRTALLAELAAHAWQPVGEFGVLMSDPVFWGWGVPRGDGHSVLVIPGLGGSDVYLTPLRGWLGRIGYRPVRSGIERNPGWSEELVQELGAIAEREFQRIGKRVSIVGHSLGGLLGRSVAARYADAVRQVIAVGSPLRFTRSRLPGHIRLTAIYSRDDRVVRHPSGIARDPGAESIEVPGSHFGLTVNATVYRHLGRLLRASNEQPATRIGRSTRCSLLVARCSLLVARCSLFSHVFLRSRALSAWTDDPGAEARVPPALPSGWSGPAVRPAGIT